MAQINMKLLNHNDQRHQRSIFGGWVIKVHGGLFFANYLNDQNSTSARTQGRDLLAEVRLSEERSSEVQ